MISGKTGWKDMEIMENFSSQVEACVTLQAFWEDNNKCKWHFQSTLAAWCVVSQSKELMKKVKALRSSQSSQHREIRSSRCSFEYDINNKGQSTKWPNVTETSPCQTSILWQKLRYDKVREISRGHRLLF